MKRKYFFVVKKQGSKVIKIATYSADADNSQEVKQVLLEAAGFLDGYAQSYTDCTEIWLNYPCSMCNDGYMYWTRDNKLRFEVVTGSDYVEECHTATIKDAVI